MQSNNHIVMAKYSHTGKIKTRPVYRYDYGQILKLEGFEHLLPEEFEVHFAVANQESATVVIGNNFEVAIPDACLLEIPMVTAWLFLHDEETDGETKFTIETPVTDRAKPSSEEPTPVEQSVVTQTIAALNRGVSRAELAANNAEQAVETINQTVEDVRQDINDIRQDVSDVRQDVTDIRQDITDVRQHANEIDVSIGYVNLNIDDINQDISDVHQDIDDIHQDIDGINQDIEAINQNIDSVEQDINDIKQDISDINQDVNGVEQDINSINQDIANVNQDIVDIKQDINDINQDIEGVKQDVDDTKQAVAEANQAAEDASQTANEAKDAADEAMQAAEGANQLAEEAKQAADDAEQAMATKADKDEVPVEYGEGAGSVKTKDFEYGGMSFSNVASARGSFAVGNNTQAKGIGSTAEGVETVSEGSGSHAEGVRTQATGGNSHAEGSSAQATGSVSHAEGYNTKATGSRSHAEGDTTEANGPASHAGGAFTVANGRSSHVFGRYNVPDSYDNWEEWTAEKLYKVGDKVKITKTVNDTVSITGYICKTENSDAIFDSEKWLNVQKQMNYAEIVGNGTSRSDTKNIYALDWDGNGHYAGDVYIHANPDSTGGEKVASESDLSNKADKTDTVLETTLSRGRLQNSPVGVGSLAFGNSVTASGIASHAEGVGSKAEGISSHAEGMQAVASGVGSHAEGNNTEAASESQHVQGKFNVADPNNVYANIVGNGVRGSNGRSNAFALTWTGDGKYAGDVYVHSNTDSTGGNKLATEDYVDDAVSHISSMAIHICTSEEYNAETGVPTVANPDSTTFYLVPGGDSPNLYIEWVYVNDAWEKFGSATIEIPVTDVQVNGASVLNDGTANVPIAGDDTYGVIKNNPNRAIGINSIGELYVIGASANDMKSGRRPYTPIMSNGQHYSAFYGLAKAAGDTTQSQSDNAVGTYTDEAKTAIKSMLGVADSSVTDVQVNGTSILQNGIANVPVASANVLGVIKADADYGTEIANQRVRIVKAADDQIKQGTHASRPITPGNQHTSAFYGLAKAAGDSTQSASSNAVGTYTDEAKAAIQTMLDVPANADLVLKADKTDTVLETTLSRGRKDNTTVGTASLAFGVDTEASGYYSVSLGLNTTASSQGAFAEGKNTVAHYIAHAEGENTQALGQWAHSQGVGTIANGAASFAGGDYTIANGHASFVTGRYNAADSYDNWPTWTANTSYEVGDRVKRNLMVQNKPTDVGYHCTVANSDATFDNAHWELDGYHMNYVEIVGNGKEYEDPETHQTVRAGSNAYALEWNGTAHYAGDVYVNANADSSGGIKVATVNDIPDTSIYATKTDTVLETTLSRGRKENTTIGVASIAFGVNVEASGMYSVATGMLTTASYNYAKAEGSRTTASASAAHAEGTRTIASGINAHAEGTSTIASAEAAHSEGTSTTAAGTGSHSEGYGTLANACLLHTEGRYNQGATIYSDWTANTEYTIGDKVSYCGIGYICTDDNTDSEFNSEHWQCIYHNSDKSLIIGNGTADSARSNAYALDWDGNGHFAGDVYVHSNADSSGGIKLATVEDIPAVPVTDVQIDGTSIVSNGIATIPIRGNIVSGSSELVTSNAVNSALNVMFGTTSTQIKEGTHNFRGIVTGKQHESVFYGLAKAAGDATQAASSNAVGTYTDEAKAAIQTMLDVPSKSDIPEVPVQDVQVNGTSIASNGTANIPIAGNYTLGTVCTGALGIEVRSNDGVMYINQATENDLKAGNNNYRPVCPTRQHNAVFYGLAKAAGDATQSASSNAVGTYTDNAKAAIKSMLGVVDGSTGTVDVSGTTPTISAIENTRYICGEVSTLTVTPASSGVSIIRFTSGTTPTVLTATGVTWPEWFDADNLEADTVYEICITDGEYGAVMTWPL